MLPYRLYGPGKRHRVVSVTEGCDIKCTKVGDWLYVVNRDLLDRVIEMLDIEAKEAERAYRGETYYREQDEGNG